MALLGLVTFFGAFLLSTSSSSKDIIVQTENGKTDKIRLQNETCQALSGEDICEKIGAKPTGDKCLCICSELTPVFTLRKNKCGCFHNNTLLEGCSLMPNATVPNHQFLAAGASENEIFFSSENCIVVKLNVLDKEDVTLRIVNKTQHSFKYNLKINTHKLQGRTLKVVVRCAILKNNHTIYTNTCLIQRGQGNVTCKICISGPKQTWPSTTARTLTGKEVSDKMGPGAIAGITLGCVVAIILLVILLACLYCKKSIKRQMSRGKNEGGIGTDSLHKTSAISLTQMHDSKPSTKTHNLSMNNRFEPEPIYNNDELPEDDRDYEDPIIPHCPSVLKNIMNKTAAAPEPRSKMSSTEDIKHEENDDSDYYLPMDSSGVPVTDESFYENTRDTSMQGDEKNHGYADEADEEHFYENKDVVNQYVNV